MTSTVFLGIARFLRQGQETARRLNFMTVNHHCPVVQRRFGKENPFNHLRGNFRVNGNAALQYLFGQAALRKDDQRAYVVFRHVLQSLHNVIDTTFRFRLRMHFRPTRRLFQSRFFGRMHVPEIFFDFYVEQNQHQCRNQQHVEQENFFRHNIPVEDTHRYARQQEKPINEHQLRRVVVTQNFGREENERKQHQNFNRVCRMKIVEEGHYAVRQRIHVYAKYTH